jgi:plastocyanin
MRLAVPRTLKAFALAFGLAAAACSAPASSDVSFGSGVRFVPQVADVQDNVGVDPAIVVVDGSPVVSYFGFPEELEEDEVAAPRPIGAATVPAVLLASRSDQGFWTRGAVAIAEEIPNIEVGFGPAFVDDVGRLSPEDVTGLSMAADGEGSLHVVWADSNGLWYATDAGGSFAAEQVVEGAASGPSVAVDDSGAPWVAHTAAGELEVAHIEGERWVVEDVAPARDCESCRTAVGIVDGSPLVAFTDESGVGVAAPGDAGWAVDTVEGGAGGESLSMAVDPDGEPRLSYYAGGEVHAAARSGGSWQVGTVAEEVAQESAIADGAATSIAVDGEGVSYVAGFDSGTGTGSVRLASDAEGSFSTVDTGGTGGGILGASPDLAVGEDGAVHVAWYDPVNQNLQVAEYGDVGELALAEPSPTGGGEATAAPTATPTGEPGPPPCEPDGTELSIVAEAVAFDTDCLAAPEGEPFTIVFENLDTVPHNVAIYEDSSFTTPLCDTCVGEVFPGVDTRDYEVEALDAGQHAFRCDIHPTIMTGTFVVA